MSLGHAWPPPRPSTLRSGLGWKLGLFCRAGAKDLQDRVPDFAYDAAIHLALLFPSEDLLRRISEERPQLLCLCQDTFDCLA